MESISTSISSPSFLPSFLSFYFVDDSGVSVVLSGVGSPLIRRSILAISFPSAASPIVSSSSSSLILSSTPSTSSVKFFSIVSEEPFLSLSFSCFLSSSSSDSAGCLSSYKGEDSPSSSSIDPVPDSLFSSSLSSASRERLKCV